MTDPEDTRTTSGADRVGAPAYGRIWHEALTTGALPTRVALPASVRVSTAALGADRTATAVLVAVVADPDARFPRARGGEVGLEEGWAFAAVVDEIVASGSASGERRPIVVVVDVPGQAYGYVEELAGIHQSLAAAADSLAGARLAGHPVVALLVGRAISGAFLAIGLQANRLVALDHDGVAVQVMSTRARARITRSTVEELDAVARFAPATAQDVASFARLGALHVLVPVERASGPTDADLARVGEALLETVRSARADGTSLAARWGSAQARRQRAASVAVREQVAAAWHG